MFSAVAESTATERRDVPAAVRRVASLVVEGGETQELFVVVAEEVARAVDVPLVSMVRYEPDGSATECANFSADGPVFPIGMRWSLEGENVLARVRDTADAARIDDHSGLEGETAELVRRAGFHSTVAVPLVAAGRVWGAMLASTTRAAPLPDSTETHLAEFTKPLETAIGNAESRESHERVAAEQAALRRVATLVAQGAPRDEVFAGVTREVMQLFRAATAGIARYHTEEPRLEIVGVSENAEANVPLGTRLSSDDPTAVAAVLRTGRSARVDGWRRVDPAASVFRRLGVQSSVASPITVEGNLWGAVGFSSTDVPLPADAGQRLEKFSELVGTAIANAEAREEVLRLAHEQAALRRVAMLVAREAPREDIFTAIAEGIGMLLGSEEIRMARYEGDENMVVEAGWGRNLSVYPVGARLPLDGDNVATRVFHTGEPARIDDYARASGTMAETVRSIGLRCVVGTPIVVDGRLWGVMAAGTAQPDPLPPDTEVRLGQFTEVMATAIANTESRARADRLAREQAALRRVAMLIVTEPPLAEVFAQIAQELSRLLGDIEGALFRVEDDGTATLVAMSGPALSGGQVGMRLPVDGNGVTAIVLREGRAHRIDDYEGVTGAIVEEGRDHLGIRAAAGCPIIVRGRLWGAVSAGRHGPGALPPETEPMLARFAELAASAIGNAEARAEVERLADEQAALRRVAVLVAEGASPAEVFDALATEIATRLGCYGVTMCRYEPGDEVTVLAHHGAEARQLPPGTRVRVDDPRSTTNIVRRTERPARVDSYADTQGSIRRLIDGLTYSSGVGVPLIVDGRLWGVAVANWTGDQPPPPETEQRMAQFAELLATAIANADSRDQLVASRARLLMAGDEARRCVARDLHDGAQQRLVHTVVTLKLARQALRDGNGGAATLVDEALGHAERSNEELRELAHGIHPSALSVGGLRGAVNSVVDRLDLAVDVDVLAERLPPEIEASAYFLVAEALTNVVKHSQAARAGVAASVRDGMLDIQVCDDGIGGADASGHGLLGMKDRVAALGGHVEITSPAGGGTCVAVTLPLPQTALADSP
jgi:GAF domain-containing protein